MKLAISDFFLQSLPFPSSYLSKPNPQRTAVVPLCSLLSRNEPISTGPLPPLRASLSALMTPLDSQEFRLVKQMNRSYKAGKLSESFYFLERMVRRGHKPDVVLSTKFIKGFFRARNIDRALRVRKILERYGEPDVFVYNVVISGFCKAKRLESASRVLEMILEMVGKGIEPDEITYNSIISCLCRDDM